MSRRLSRMWGRIPHWFLAISDQGLVAVLNLSLSVTITRVAGLSALGRFALVATTITLAMGVARLLVTDPWLASRTAPREPVPELRWLVSLAASGAAVATGVVVLLSGGGDARWLFAVPLAVCVVVQDFGRYLCYRVERAEGALASDLGVLLGAAAAFGVAAALGRVGLTAVLVSWLVGLLVGIVVLRRRLWGRLDPRGAWQWWRRFCRSLATRLALDTAAYMLGASGSLYLLAYVGTQRDVGLVRIVQTMFSPAALVVTGLTIWLVPSLANRSPDQATRMRTTASIWLTVAGLPLILMAVVVGPWFATVVFGIAQAPPVAAMVLAGVSTAAMAMAAPWVAAARVSGRYLPIAWSRAAAAVLTLAGMLWISALRSATGYLGLLAFQNVTVAVAAVATVRRTEATAAVRRE